MGFSVPQPRLRDAERFYVVPIPKFRGTKPGAPRTGDPIETPVPRSSPTAPSSPTGESGAWYVPRRGSGVGASDSDGSGRYHRHKCPPACGYHGLAETPGRCYHPSDCGPKCRHPECAYRVPAPPDWDFDLDVRSSSSSAYSVPWTLDGAEGLKGGSQHAHRPPAIVGPERSVTVVRSGSWHSEAGSQCSDSSPVSVRCTGRSERTSARSPYVSELKRSLARVRRPRPKDRMYTSAHGRTKILEEHNFRG